MSRAGSDAALERPTPPPPLAAPDAGSGAPATTPVQAYYKLSFPNFDYYLQTLSVTIGRRPQEHQRDVTPPPSSPRPDQPSTEGEETHETRDGELNGNEPQPKEDADALLQLASLAEATADGPVASSSTDPAPAPSSPKAESSTGARSLTSHSHSSAAFPHIDVDLGPLKSVSRLHARIDYDDSIDKFVLYVNGRNGAWVDGQWVGCGGRVALGARTKIQIGSRTFHFVLPPPVAPATPLTPDPSPDGEAATLPTQKEERATRASKRHHQSPSPRKRRRLHQYPASDLRLTLDPSSPPSPPVPLPMAASSSAGATNSLRDRPQRYNSDESEGEDGDMPLVSIDDLQQAELEDLQAMDRSDDDLESEEDSAPQPSSSRSTKHKGKARAKSNTARKGRKGATKSKISSRAARPLPAGPSSSSLHPPVVQRRSSPPKNTRPESPQDPNAPRQPKKYMTQRLIAKTQLAQLPRPPPDQMPPKPPFTYAILCFRAIQELGGKASLSEIVNWIRDRHEWYRWNDECGWESSVRHNLSSNPGFVKSRRDAEVERIVMTTGQQKKVKGFFWSIDPKHEESFREKEMEIIEAGSRAKAAAAQKAKAAQQGVSSNVPAGDAIQQQRMFASTGAGGPLVPLVKPAMPVPMMAPRMMPGAGPPPPPLGMAVAPGTHPSNGSVPMMLPPMMIQPPLPTPFPHLHPPPPSNSHPPTHLPPTPLSQSLPDVCLSITVGPPPAGAKVDTGFSPDLEGPPITLHGGALFLNPTIFSGLTQPQIHELQQLKAQKALEILMEYTKNYVKERIVKQGKAKAKAKAEKGKTSGTISPTPAPSTPQLDATSILALAHLATATSGPHSHDPATTAYFQTSQTASYPPQHSSLHPASHLGTWGPASANGQNSGSSSTSAILHQPSVLPYLLSGIPVTSETSQQPDDLMSALRTGEEFSDDVKGTSSVDLVQQPGQIVA